jgi:menaquinone-dependent protoporphyrinogen oxidase
MTVLAGALDPGGPTLSERTVRRMPAGRGLLPDGDFRDWEDIDAWAEAMARELSRPGPGIGEPDGHVST